MPRLATQLATWVGGARAAVDLCGTAAVAAALSGAAVGIASASARLRNNVALTAFAVGAGSASALLFDASAGAALVDSSGNPIVDNATDQNPLVQN